MDFGILPPEVNSGRMYAGPGAGPMLAAAAAWDGLAAGLESTAHSYESVLLELAKGWTGPSATAMASAASPYASWMHHTAAQAEHAANQARFAAATYESAFTMTVPPPVIAANRSQLLALIATNFFGQNTPAIAATEAHYAEMWAQDAAAMYGYADGSSTASMLAPFPQPPQTANPGGLGHQATAAANTGANTSATNGQSALSQLMSALPGLVSPMANGGASSSGISTALHAAIIAGDVGFDLLGAFIVDGIGAFAIDPAGVAIGYATHDINPARNGGKRPYLLAGSSAGVGKATSIGGLSVPPSWTAAGPELRPTASAKPANNTNSSDTSADPSANPLNTMAMTGLAGLAGTAGLGRGQKPPQTAGQQRLKPQQKAANVPEPEIATELRELIDLNYAGILTDKEYAEQKERLLNR